MTSRTYLSRHENSLTFRKLSIKIREKILHIHTHTHTHIHTHTHTHIYIYININFVPMFI